MHKNQPLHKQDQRRAVGLQADHPKFIHDKKKVWTGSTIITHMSHI
jgi:hypothetical protein